jgi:CRISPR/Cas system CSM-associated protein Csm5 (group 7 of RAMP superfamily)
MRTSHFLQEKLDFINKNRGKEVIITTGDNIILGGGGGVLSTSFNTKLLPKEEDWANVRM